MPEFNVVAQATVTATLFADGRLVLMEHGHWHQAEGQLQTYTEWHEDIGTCDPEELMFKLVTEMQGRV